ncbi:hypothetical protein LTS12_028222, partial [Elasticomyces elasticus]
AVGKGINILVVQGNCRASRRCLKRQLDGAVGRQRKVKSVDEVVILLRRRSTQIISDMGWMRRMEHFWLMKNRRRKRLWSIYAARKKTMLKTAGSHCQVMAATDWNGDCQLSRRYKRSLLTDGGEDCWTKLP